MARCGSCGIYEDFLEAYPIFVPHPVTQERLCFMCVSQSIRVMGQCGVQMGYTGQILAKIENRMKTGCYGGADAISCRLSINSAIGGHNW